MNQSPTSPTSPTSPIINSFSNFTSFQKQFNLNQEIKRMTEDSNHQISVCVNENVSIPIKVCQTARTMIPLRSRNNKFLFVLIFGMFGIIAMICSVLNAASNQTNTSRELLASQRIIPSETYVYKHAPGSIKRLVDEGLLLVHNLEHFRSGPSWLDQYLKNMSDDVADNRILSVSSLPGGIFVNTGLPSPYLFYNAQECSLLAGAFHDIGSGYDGGEKDSYNLTISAEYFTSFLKGHSQNPDIIVADPDTLRAAFRKDIDVNESIARSEDNMDMLKRTRPYIGDFDRHFQGSHNELLVKCTKKALVAFGFNHEDDREGIKEVKQQYLEITRANTWRLQYADVQWKGTYPGIFKATLW